MADVFDGSGSLPLWRRRRAAYRAASRSTAMPTLRMRRGARILLGAALFRREHRFHRCRYFRLGEVIASPNSARRYALLI